MARKIQFRRGTAASWTSTDPTLAIGELGLETDTGKIKIGDGVTAWSARPYIDAAALAHIADTSAAHAAASIASTPAGTLAATDVQAALNELDTEKAPLASPALTGTPTAPTAATATNTTQVATTAFVRANRAEQAAADISQFATSGAAGPGPLRNVSTAAQSTTPRIVEYIGTTCWGSKSDGTIWSSTDDGVTWAQRATGPVAGYFTRLIFCSDGEVLIQYSATIRKSTGWATNPNTATWTTKVTANAPAYFLPWGFDGNGTKFIATEYAATGDWASSNNAWISTDSGSTWSVVWDQAARFPGDSALSHCHAACYDAWEDRFWLSEGHSASCGVYWSGDNGATWTAVAGGTVDGAPTVLVATDNGIVCGTDSSADGTGGMYGIARRALTSQLKMEKTWSWFPGRAGIVGFAQRGFRDARSGLVYMGFNSSFSDVKPVLVAGTAEAGGLVWEATTAEDGGRIWNQVVTANGKLIGHYNSPAAGGSGDLILTGYVSKGALDTVRLNTGNILGATTAEPTSVAIGRGASVPTSAVESVVIGSGASVSSTGQSVVIGEKATAPATCVVIGDGASSTAAGNVVIGQGATSTSTAQVTTVVGSSATANLTGNTAIGNAASATNSQSTAIGRLASAAANDSVALGRSSSVPAGYNGSVALGASTTVTAAAQVQIGAKHIEFTELAADAAAGAANSARLYVKDNGSGKSQLCVRFASGAVQVIATEP